MDISYFRKIQNAEGCKSLSEVQRNQARLAVKRSFENTIDVVTLYFWRLNALTEDTVRFQINEESYSSGFAVKGTCIDEIQIGEVLYSEEKDNYFICTESYDKSGVHYACKLMRCNCFLKWQDDKQSILEYPALDINASQSREGVQSQSKQIVIGSAQHGITITADENTIKLDHGKRFFLDRNTENPTVYKLTQTDTTTYNYGKGYIKLTLCEDEYDRRRDSTENFLCDYKTAGEPTEITYNGLAEVRCGGAFKTFTAQTADDVTWSILCTDEQKESLILDTDGNKARIKCLSDETLIGGSFKLKANDSELVIDITGGV